MDDPEPHSVRDRIGAAGGVELIDEGADMELGVNRDPKPAGDGLVGSALGQERWVYAGSRRDNRPKVAPSNHPASTPAAVGY